MPGVPLVVVESPYRALTGPLIAYLDVLDQSWPPDKETPITFVVIPEFVPRHWWERLLYNQSTEPTLRRALLGRPDTVVTTVPYRREEAEAFCRREEPAPRKSEVRCDRLPGSHRACTPVEARGTAVLSCWRIPTAATSPSRRGAP